MVPSISVVGSVADSGFNPKWISGLQLWYDAADSNTLFSGSTGSTLATPSGSVGRWEDKSGNNWHATQSAVANQPLRITGSLFNGLDTVRFDGNDTLVLASQAYGVTKNKNEVSFFVVAATDRKASNGDFLYISTGTSANTGRLVLRNLGVSRVQPLIRRLDTSPATNLNYYRVVPSGSLNLYSLRMKFNVSASSFVANGTEQPLSTNNVPASWSGSIENTDSGVINIGSTNATANFMQGNMGEILFYDRYLTDIERRSIERYLLRKWNIRSYDQKTSSSIDIFTSVDLYLDANNPASNPGSGTTWNDLSGNNRNATLTNGASFAVSESISYVDCDSTNEYVDCGSILNYTSSDFSLSCWARVTTGNSSTFNTILLTNAQNSGEGYLLYVASDNTVINNQILCITYQAAANQINTTLPQGSLGNSWIFYSLVRVSNRVKLYINGVYAQSTVTSITNPVASTSTFTAGAFIGGNQASLVKIGMIIAHSKSLNDQEVLELYNFTKNKYKIVD